MVSRGGILSTTRSKRKASRLGLNAVAVVVGWKKIGYEPEDGSAGNDGGADFDS